MSINVDTWTFKVIHWPTIIWQSVLAVIFIECINHFLLDGFELSKFLFVCFFCIGFQYTHMKWTNHKYNSKVWVDLYKNYVNHTMLWVFRRLKSGPITKEFPKRIEKSIIDEANTILGVKKNLHYYVIKVKTMPKQMF
jgi:hypothetical protein